VKVRCGCGNKSEEWVCEDVQREKEKRGTLRLRKEVEAEVARGKAKSRNENALLACTSECEEFKKREAERREEERAKQEEQRKRKEREEEEKRSAGGRAKKGGAPAIKRTSAKWREGEDQNEGSGYGWWLKAVFVSAVVVLLIALIVAAVIQSEWRGTQAFFSNSTLGRHS
jgi:Flp pilus assembly protein TadB